MKSIKSLREKAGITQSEMAEKLDVTQGTVAMWETGKSIPKSSMLPLLAKILNCEIGDLFSNQAS